MTFSCFFRPIKPDGVHGTDLGRGPAEFSFFRGGGLGMDEGVVAAVDHAEMARGQAGAGNAGDAFPVHIELAGCVFWKFFLLVSHGAGPKPAETEIKGGRSRGVLGKTLEPKIGL
jgi:hypothetical protein